MTANVRGGSGSDTATPAPPLCFLSQTSPVCFLLGGFVHLPLRYRHRPLVSPPLPICVVISADRRIFIASDKLRPASASAIRQKAFGFCSLCLHLISRLQKLSRAEFFFSFFSGTPLSMTSRQLTQIQWNASKIGTPGRDGVTRMALGLRILRPCLSCTV